MKTYHVYQEFKRSGEQVYTDFKFNNIEEAQALADLISELGKGKVRGFIQCYPF